MAQYEHLPIYKRAFDMAIYIDNMVGKCANEQLLVIYYQRIRSGTRSVVIVREMAGYIGRIKKRLPVRRIEAV
ncbi:hypothetical protein MBAV_006328 [Candidatus Magnetobacterium bavaricum]|uniref:Uncharacterized protein n=1 Tax=Candidatus Magnetobacterium bavaricum TaxID=29290 RepID=A0A0F3GHQ3_9BACT|nr:hypothetical protein MBAV_006328 [Candidatus Magnetobacterium bavaricum]